MTLLHRLWAFIRGVVTRRRAEADLHDELQTFVEMATADHVRGGCTPDQARRLALLRLGGVEQTKERVRRVRSAGWVDEVERDITSGLRQVTRNPGFSIVAIITLALGIGVNTAVFSAVDAVLLRPLPFVDADRLVMVWGDMTRTGGEARFFTTPPEWAEWRRHNTVFTDIAASQPVAAALSGSGDPEDLQGRKVTSNFWTVLGVQPLLGRVFTEGEDTSGTRVVVISHGLWQRRFGGASDVVGRAVTLNDQTYEVIGVMPRAFYFMPSRETEVWVPASFTPGMLTNWSWHDVHCIARLRPGVTLDEAHDAMSALSLRVSADHVSTPRAARVTPLREELTGRTSMSLTVLFAATGAVLLIACVNVANLLLARGAVRQRELSLRAALGAGRGRLVRQLLVESLVLAGVGATAGVVLAIPAMQFLETLVPHTMAAVDLKLDWRVLAASVAITAIAGVAFGLMPAFRGSRVSLNDVLRGSGHGSVGARTHRFQHALIVLETALALILLTMGGLVLQTFRHLHDTDLGIRRDQLVTFVTPLFRYPDFDQRVAFVTTLLERIRAVPGVEGAGAISHIPLTVTDQSTYYRLDGQTNEETRQQLALSRIVTRDYFETVGAALREGRFFDPSDTPSDAPSTVVNETFANRHFPGRSPIGTRLQFGNRGQQGYWYTVVGVVRDIRERGVAEDVHPAVYRVLEQADQTRDATSGIVVRSAVDPATLVPALRSAIWSLDRNLPMARVQTLDDIVNRQLSVPSQNMQLLGAFALLALALAAVGLYGVLSYAVTQRTREIGMRMAFGARAGQILLSVGTRGIGLTIGGLVVGLLGSVLAERAMRALFFEVTPRYGIASAVASTLLLCVAALACFVPARRAARLSPVVALQQAD